MSVQTVVCCSLVFKLVVEAVHKQFMLAHVRQIGLHVKYGIKNNV